MSTTTACAQPGCDGALDDLGYCDTCGTKAQVVAAQAATVASGSPCPEGCGGMVAPDGYCDTCGARAGVATVAPAAGPGAGPAGDGPLSALAASTRTSPFTSGSASGSQRVRRTDSTRTSSRRSGIGAGVVIVDPVPTVDPTGIVMDPPEVTEDKRFCSKCGEPVGRSKDKREGRLEGFCPNCRTHYDFVPKLEPGEMVAGQYEVVGPIAHGGLGWIYLARDTAVSGRWVVLKGLLNAGDDAAMVAAVAERRFLAQVQHPQIVEIYNFATHKGAGYTVMEYVGGKSLKQLLAGRRKAAGAP
ncbi:MAG TPA: serine/threonine protein kinase, partial [Nitriliruptorales bacterium]